MFIYNNDIALQNMDFCVLLKSSKLRPCLWEITPPLEWPLPSNPPLTRSSLTLISFFCFAGKTLFPGFLEQNLSPWACGPPVWRGNNSLPWGETLAPPPYIYMGPYIYQLDLHPSTSTPAVITIYIYTVITIYIYTVITIYI